MIDASQPTWQQVFTATETAIATISGLTVIWAWQNYNAPAMSYVRVGFGVAATVGQDWVQEWPTGVVSPPNQEIGLTVGGTREMALQIEAFSSATVETIAAATSLSIVDDITSGLRLPSIRDALSVVGLTPFSAGPTNYIPEVVSTGFRGRASCDVRCYLPARMAEEFATYIASITATINASDAIAVTVTAP